MKTLLLSFFLFLHPASKPIISDIKSSVVVKRISSCDYFVLYNNSGYVVAEHYSGKEFDEDKVVYGNINGYGFRDVYDKDLDRKEHIYIEDWGLSKEDAYEKLIDKCK